MDSNHTGEKQIKPGAAKDAVLGSFYIQGRQLGLAGHPLEFVPGQPGTPERAQAERGWRSGRDQIAAAYATRPCAIATKAEPEHALE